MTTRLNWQEISDRVGDTSDTVSKLSTFLCHRMMDISSSPDSPEFKAIMRLKQAAEQAEEALAGLCYLSVPQTEWTGGENFVTRDPHIVKSFSHA